jgi:hypothetical protein
MDLYSIKIIIAISLCFMLNVYAQPKEQLPENSVWSCVRWTWSGGNVFNRQVNCLEWRQEDCSKRLHKQLCKGNK